jgi:hypothetical protein
MLFEHLDRGHYVPRIMRWMLRRRRNLFLLCILAGFSALVLLDFNNGVAGLWYCQFSQSSPVPSVHLVLAAISWIDLEWTEDLKVPNLQVIPYIADDPTAKYHARENRANGA